jgi:hypothetical protein
MPWLLSQLRLAREQKFPVMTEISRVTATVQESAARSGGVVDVVLGHVGGVPGDGAVVGVVVKDGQAVVGGGRGDDEVGRRGAAVVTRADYLVLDAGHPPSHGLRDGRIRYRLLDISVVSSYSAASRALYRNSARCG